MMRGEMMIAGFVVTRGFPMMTGGVLVMFCCFVMMLGCLLGHKVLVERSEMKRAGGGRLHLAGYWEMPGSLQLAATRE
jgi:hypothetical protein